MPFHIRKAYCLRVFHPLTNTSWLLGDGTFLLLRGEPPMAKLKPIKSANTCSSFVANTNNGTADVVHLACPASYMFVQQTVSLLGNLP